MSKIEQVLFSGNTHTTTNRAPNAKSGALDIKLSAAGSESLEFIATDLHPRAEQLFSGAWAACYTSAVEIAATMKKVTLPADYSVDIQVSIGSCGAGHCIGAQFTIRMPGLATKVVEELAQLAHQLCPYSKAVHGNIEVGLNVITA